MKIDHSIKCSRCNSYIDTIYSNGSVWWLCARCFEQEEQKPEFVRGEEVEVRDDRHTPDDLDASRNGKVICEIEHEYKYVVEMEMSDWPLCRKYIRKLPKQEAWPKVFYIEKDVDDFVKGYSVSYDPAPHEWGYNCRTVSLQYEWKTYVLDVFTYKEAKEQWEEL
jgi:hypothetical protein